MSPMNNRLMLPRSGGAVVDPVFDPNSISGLVSWYAANRSLLYQNTNGTTPATAEGDPVGYVQDLSGNGRHLLTVNSSDTQVNASRPTLRLNSLNRRATLFYDGTNDYLTHNSNSTTYNGGVNVFVVTKHATNFVTNTIGVIANVVDSSTDTSNGYVLCDLPFIVGDPLDFQTSAVSPRVSTSPLDGTWKVLSCRVSSSGSDIRVNGSVVATAASAASITLNSRFTLGAAWTGGTVSRFSNGGFAELIVYHANLSTADINAVNDYLKAKYAL